MVSECAFCKILSGDLPASIVYEDEFVLAFMDLYPMLPGHVLVIPKTHQVTIDGLTPNVRAHLFEVGAEIARIQKTIKSPFMKKPCVAHNFFINDGPQANQHVPHVHLHVLPRGGDDFRQAIFSFVSRTNNFFGVSQKRERLDQLALSFSALMPQTVSGPLTGDC